MVYRDSDQRIFATTGVGVCYLELSALSTGQDPVYFQPADYTLLSVYPNPFNAQAMILYDLDKPQHVSLRMFNVEGKLVQTLADSDQEAGRHTIRVDASDLASGSYFVEIGRKSGNLTQKIVLAK